MGMCKPKVNWVAPWPLEYNLDWFSDALVWIRVISIMIQEVFINTLTL